MELVNNVDSVSVMVIMKWSIVSAVYAKKCSKWVEDEQRDNAIVYSVLK